MEDRLLKLLDTEQLSSSKFADVIGVQRSSVSHILSGRNKPSFDFIHKTLKSFPLLSADWLILGKGDMYNDMSNYVSGALFGQDEAGMESNVPGRTETQPVAPQQEPAIDSNAGHISENSVQKPVSAADTAFTRGLESLDKKKSISRVILFYDDNSFHTYEPGN